MRIDRLWLVDFRSYAELDLSLSDGLTALVGDNGVGKSNLLEALGLLSSLKSFRGAPTESLIRRGADRAVVRAEGERDGRPVLLELELGAGRLRAQVNRQRLSRARDLLGALRVTVFAPDDLALCKEGPKVRRDYLDDLLVALDPAVDRRLGELDKILRQRGALLRRAGGQLDDATAYTLDVWDDRLASTGELLAGARVELAAALNPLVQEASDRLAGGRAEIGMHYESSWGDDLAEALRSVRDDDLRRGVTTVGPHRDEVRLTLNGLSARTESSQGEQRSLSLALRLAGHHLVTDRLGEPPLLLLDDVLSELDDGRAAALLASLPPGQTVLTSAVSLPAGTVADQTYHWPEAGLVPVLDS